MEEPKMPRSVLLVGATGLVGRSLLPLLLCSRDYQRVVVLARRELDLKDPKLETVVTDFSRIPSLREKFAVDDVFSALGTTIRKAGSQPAFYEVDFTYNQQIAQLASEAGASRYFLVSAVGANSSSGFFYNRVKGELEDAVTQMGFSTVHIFRPSLLLGEREEFRLGEKVGSIAAKIIRPVLNGPLARFRPIEAKAVAEAMVYLARKGQSGVHIHESDEIQKIHELLTLT